MLAIQNASPQTVGLPSTRTMTIEARTAVYGGNGVQQPRRDSSSSNGCQESPSEDDGYFTSAVSVQHKTSSNVTQQVIATEVTSSSSSFKVEKNFKKVVWPNISSNHSQHSQQSQSHEEQHHRHQQENFGSNSATDHPMAWMKNVSNADHQTKATAESMEMEIQKRVWDATTGRHLSRSRSKSKNIMERARSFERAAEAVGSAHNSRAPSRQGSSSNIPEQQLASGRSSSHLRARSPSAGRQMNEFWQKEAASLSRPQSRAGRERSVGRVDPQIQHWEAAMAKAKGDGYPPKTPPPQRRRELKAPSPAPPATPPVMPPRATVVLEDRSRPDHEQTPSPPPLPPQESELKAIQSLSQEEKEQIVEQWVQQTSTQQQAQDELEKFAYEIAETVLSTMEKHQQEQQEHQQQQQDTSEEIVTSSVSATSAATATVATSSTAVTSTTTTMQEKRCESTNEEAQAKMKVVESSNNVSSEKRKERASSVKPVLPTAFSNPQSPFKKFDNQFGHVKTGHVNEKRNFWLRSTSMEKLQNSDVSSGRRKQCRLEGESWIKQAAAPESTRPESSLGQVISGATDHNVKNVVSGWSDLSKSKSSAAVLQEEKRMRRARSRDIPSFPAADVDQVDNLHKSVNLSEANTKQVKDTVTRWGKTPESTELLRTHTPTRHIGDTFAENKVSAEEEEANNADDESTAAPWRKKEAVPIEPSVKVVNVAVENNSANMRFSESAEALMAKHTKQQQTSEVKQTMTSVTQQSSSTFEQQEQVEQKTMTASSVISQPTLQKETFEPRGVTLTNGVSIPPQKSPAPSKKTTYVTQQSTSSYEQQEQTEQQIRATSNIVSQPTSKKETIEQRGVTLTNGVSIPPARSPASFKKATSSVQQSNLTCEQQEQVEQKTTVTTASVVPQPSPPREEIEQKGVTLTNGVSLPPPKSPAPSKKGKSALNLVTKPPPPLPLPPTSSIDKPPASSAVSKAISTSSSSQVSMLNSILTSQEYQEYQETSSSIGMTSSATNEMTAAPVLSEWLAETKPKNDEVVKKTAPIAESKKIDDAKKDEPQKVEIVKKIEELVDPILRKIEQLVEPKKVEAAKKNESVAGSKKADAEQLAEPKKVEVVGKNEPTISSDHPDTQSEKSTTTKSSDENRPKTPATTMSTDERQLSDLNSIVKQDNKDFLEMRSRMLQEVASLRPEEDDSSKDFSTNQEKAADQAKLERNRELAEIAEMRCRSKWQGTEEFQICRSGSNKSIDPELEEARSTIRNAAAKWQEREQKHQKIRYGTPPSGRTTPSRLIGALFKKGSDHWSMDDAPVDDEDLLPPPPTDIEMDVSLPEPPLRDSSKDVMMEYSRIS